MSTIIEIEGEQKTAVNERLTRIVNVLILNGSFVQNIGLLNGKMGIAIFIYNYVRYTGNEIFKNYADELIGEIYDEITIATPTDFENGLSGIGWGFEYLEQNDYVDADTDEILEELDTRLVKKVESEDFSEEDFLKDIVGAGRYFLKRQEDSFSGRKKKHVVAHRKTLSKIADILEQRIDTCLLSSKEPAGYLITWDYPSLLVFLGELYKLDISHKTEKIIRQLIEPLFKTETYFPQKQANQLLLAAALLELNSYYGNAGIMPTVTNLLKRVNKLKIRKELTQGSALIENGTMGIALLYKRIFDLTNDEAFAKQSENWLKEILNMNQVDTGYAGFWILDAQKHNAFGLLNGIVGLGLTLLSVLSKYYCININACPTNYIKG